jgi:import inner membrane translocase subunit TIM50
MSRTFSEPIREKLLPDWPYFPNVPVGTPCPPTLVLDLEGTLCTSTWDRKFGWRHVKRPGVEQFLKEMSRYYEVVVFTSNIGGVADPIITALDKDGVVLHRLYREATKFHNGVHVKDMSVLNRDLRKVIMVDDDPKAFQLQPNNAIRIAPFTDAKDKNDTALEDLTPFLKALCNEGVADFPALLKSFRTNEAKDVARVPDVYQSFFQLLAQRRVMSAAEATQCIEDCAAVPGMAKTVHGTPDVADAIARLNVALKPIMLEIKSMLDEGVTYHGLVNNTPDALAKKHGSKLSPGEAELFKKIVAAIAAAGAGSENPAAFEASTDELERLRGDLTQSAYREFIGRLRGAMWLTMGPTGGLAFGIRTKLELSTLLETHGVPLPQYIYH